MALLILIYAMRLNGTTFLTYLIYGVTRIFFPMFVVEQLIKRDFPQHTEKNELMCHYHVGV